MNEVLSTECLICQKKCKNIRSLTAHITTVHKITSAEYYLKYLNGKKTLCKICDKETEFKNIKLGYMTYCSKRCFYNDKEVNKTRAESLKNSLMKIYGVEHSCFLPTNFYKTHKYSNTDLGKEEWDKRIEKRKENKQI